MPAIRCLEPDDTPWWDDEDFINPWSVITDWYVGYRDRDLVIIEKEISPGYSWTLVIEESWAGHWLYIGTAPGQPDRAVIFRDWDGWRLTQVGSPCTIHSENGWWRYRICVDGPETIELPDCSHHRFPVIPVGISDPMTLFMQYQFEQIPTLFGL